MATLRYTFTAANIKSLAGMVATVNGVNIVAGTTVSDGDSVKLIAPNGKAFTYSFGTPPLPLTRFKFPSSELRFNYSNNSTVAEIVVNLGDSAEVATNFYAPTGNVQPINDRYSFTQKDIDLLESQNIVMTKNGSNVVVGTTVRNDDLFIAKCPNNRIFYKDGNLSSIRFQMALGGGFVEFTINEKGNEANCVFNWPTSAKTKVSAFICKTQVVTPEVAAYNGVYAIDDSILNEVNKKRFVVVNDGEGGPKTIDYGAYIINVIELPFKVNQDVISEPDNIILGALNTNIKANILTTDNYFWDLGKIKVVGDKNNSLDYFNSKAILNLPYCDPINIDLDYVLNQTISINYSVNLYKGNAVLNIHSTYTDSIFITRAIDLGIQVPYINPLSVAPENLNISFVGDNGVKVPFIDIVKIDVNNINGKFSIPVEDEDILSSHKGYVEVDKINIVSNCTNNELDRLITILKNGVFL